MNYIRSTAFAVFAALILLLGVSLQAQESTPGITKDSIRIGSCSALSGPASFLGMQTQIGALAYFHMVNDQGGIHGRKIEVVSFDDGYDPEKTSGCSTGSRKRACLPWAFLWGRRRR